MQNLLRITLLTSILSASAAEVARAEQPSNIIYPQTRRSDQVDNYHGVQVADPFRWLEDANSAETRAWINAQNALSSNYLSLLPARDSIRDRLSKIWDYPKYGVPIRARNRYFYLDNSGLQNQAVLYMKEGLEGKATVILDPNSLSGAGGVSVSDFKPSPNANYLAYSISVSGSDWTEIRLRDIRRGTDAVDTLKWVKFSSIAWTRDSEGFFYSRYAAPRAGEELTGVLRNQKLYYHRVGSRQAEDILILERPDAPELGFAVETAHDGELAIITVWRGTDTRNMVYLIDLAGRGADKVTAPVVRLIDRFVGSFRFVHADSLQVYFHTDYLAPRGRIVRINIEQPREEFWTTVLAEGPDAIQDVTTIGGMLLVNYLKDARSYVNVHDARGVLQSEIPLPGLGTVQQMWGEPDEREGFFSFTSYLNPPTIFQYDVRTRRTQEYRAPRVEFPFGDFETRQLFATSKDGTRIPMFVTARRGIPLDGSHPTILYGYGGFNIALTPEFSPAVLAWLERGGIYVSVNTRGGGEYGRPWHEAGTLLKKQNVFDDFIAAAEHLISNRYTTSSRLALMGGSNGGLLVGAVMTQRPELAAAVLPSVGVMDMLRFQNFTIGWAWTSDYGSSADAEQFKTLFAYSPLHNLRAGTRYPATLITTADHDDRVVPAHSFKFAAALQAAQGAAAAGAAPAAAPPALIRIDTESGHGAGKPTDKRIEEWADRLAFAWAHTGTGPR